MTREQFLFYEMRTTAKLIEEGVNNTEIMEKVFNVQTATFCGQQVV